jgi:hypothetical protein
VLITQYQPTAAKAAKQTDFLSAMSLLGERGPVASNGQSVATKAAPPEPTVFERREEILN